MATKLDNFLKELKKGESCSLCGNIKDLQVHHKDENRKNNQISNLIILCRSCHSSCNIFTWRNFRIIISKNSGK